MASRLEVDQAVMALLVALMTLAGLVLAGLAAYVAWRRGTAPGLSLAVMLVAVAWWGLAYALELSASDLAAKGTWGDLKYVGVCALAPAWLVFSLQYTGRGRLVTRRLLAALLAEPLVVLTLLLVPRTHHLVRFYPKGEAGKDLPRVGTGPVFWAHLAYSNAMILIGTALFVATMVRLSRSYRRMAAVLVTAAVLPWVANLLHNFEVGWFERVDLTPFAFTVTGGVLVWGVFRERLIDLSPEARSVVIDSMSDGVFVLDAFGRILDVNPSGAGLLGGRRGDLIGSHALDTVVGEQAGELSLGDGEERRWFDVLREPLVDRGGRTAGEIVVLRDITERARAEARLQNLLAERSRVAAALQASLVPGPLPRVPLMKLASRYEPAGDGSEIGGDFFDVFPLDHDSWGVVLGDVSGKGAEAAAVTALARYTLRTLADADHLPSHTLRELNNRLLAATTEERHCTLVYAVARPSGAGIELTVSLAGHHPPVMRRAGGTTEIVGRLGTALGLFEHPELYDSRTMLGCDDVLCLYTDGLVEARQGSDMFGVDRVSAVMERGVDVPVDDLADELVEAVRRFHGAALADDLAILVMRAQCSQPLDSAAKALVRPSSMPASK